MLEHILLAFLIGINAVTVAPPRKSPVVHVRPSVSSPSPTILPTSTLTPSPTPINSPTPTQLPTITPTQTLPVSSYESDFDQYSSKYEIDKNLLKKIAKCESGINPGSRNGDYGGMFQFATQTWITTRQQMGLDTSPDKRFSGKDAIEAAAFKIHKDGSSAWSGCL